MPYKKPPERIKALPPHAQEIWVAAYNSAYEQYDGDEAKANATAWAAVKQQYEQDAQGRWRKKQTSAKTATAVVEIETMASADGPPEWVRVLPLGRLELNDDRQPIEVTEESVKTIIERFAKKRVDMVIDYEHKTMSGDPAPAAGWVKELQARSDGLWARVQWTDRAADYIRSREYRYYSPTVRLDKNRQVRELLHIGLTNFPAIAGIDALAARSDGTDGGDDVLIEQVKDILGLSDSDISETEILLKIHELKNNGGQHMGAEKVPETVIEALQVKPSATWQDVIAGIEKLQLAAARAKDLETELSTLKQTIAKERAQALIDEALKSGKTSPAELDRAGGKLRQIAEIDPEFFKEFVLSREPGAMVPVEKLPDYTKAKEHAEALTPDEERIIRLTGLTVEQYRAQKEAEKAGRPLVGF